MSDQILIETGGRALHKDAMPGGSSGRGGRRRSVIQLLLLAELMYLPSRGPFVSVADTKSRTVGEWMEEISQSHLGPDMDDGFCMDSIEQLKILAAVKKDPELSGMEIVTAHIDHAPYGGGGVSAVFMDRDTKEAVIAFRGTALGEWKDDLAGGGPTGTKDGVSTQQQRNALEWYRSLDKEGLSLITVTGHSKGGNKAKYITILDDTVDRCVSFDGQGFSDEFIGAYQQRIARSQGKIENHNSAYDLVNILLNDVGRRSYYESRRSKKGGLFREHCPNVLLHPAEDGGFVMKSVPQSWEMQETDRFVNSCLRSLGPIEKVRMLGFLGDAAQMGAEGSLDVNGLLRLSRTGGHLESVSYLLAYLIRYEQAEPRFSDAINSMLRRFGMKSALLCARLAEDILNSREFDMVYDIAGFMADRIPAFIIDWIGDFAQKQGVTVAKEQIRQLLSILSKTGTYMDHIQIHKDGEDRIVQDINVPYMDVLDIDIPDASSAYTRITYV